MLNWKNLNLSGDEAKALEVLAGNEEFNNFVGSSITAREEAVKTSVLAEYKPKIDEFRSTNVSLKEQLEKFADFDADEYHKLKKLGSDPAKANEALSALEQDYKAKLEAKDKMLADLANEKKEYLTQAEQKDFKIDFANSIDKYNAQNPTMPIDATARRVVLNDAMSSYKKLGDKFVMLKDGEEFKGDEGFGTMDEWLAKAYVPENPFVVSKTGGSGAGGSNTTPSNDNMSSVSKIAQGLANLNK